MSFYINYLGSESNSLSTVAVATITFTLTFIITLTVTAIVTFIVTYYCVKKKFGIELKLKNQLQPSQETALYEQVCPSNKRITKDNFELQTNPAYATSHKVIMDTNPAYESCK